MLVSVNRFADAVCRIVPDCTVYLTGSAAVGDYRHGWSDIDMLFLTSASLSEKAATSLVNLRQAYGDDPYIPKIEGGVVPFCAILSGEKTAAVYWGTSGQRITEGYTADCFALAQAEDWILLRGTDVRTRIPKPSPDALYSGVKRHWETIRDHAARTKTPIYRCGWMLDIARCLYTLKTGRVVSKTYAGETALRLGWCPDEDALRDALAVRCDPTLTKWISDESIACFNAVLGEGLEHPMPTDPCYCGHDCGRCLVRLAEEDDSGCMRKQAQEFYRDTMNLTLTDDELHCSGGRSDAVMHLCADCPMRKCCRERGIGSCIDCGNPCGMYLEYAEKYVNRMGQAEIS